MSYKLFKRFRIFHISKKRPHPVPIRTLDYAPPSLKKDFLYEAEANSAIEKLQNDTQLLYFFDCESLLVLPIFKFKKIKEVLNERNVR